MTTQVKTGNVQAYQIILYNRALHPELFQPFLRGFRKRGAYEFEAWLSRGVHMVRFDHKRACACELLTDQQKSPVSGVVSAFLCAGEREYEKQLERTGITYMTSVQTETLPEAVYAETYRELSKLAADNHALANAWNDDAGRCLSILDVQELCREVHVQSYHMVASGGVVVRTQSLFEHK